VNLPQIKINDIKTVIFITSFKVIYFNTAYNKIIPQAYKGVLLTKLWTFKDGKKAHFSKPLKN